MKYEGPSLLKLLANEAEKQATKEKLQADLEDFVREVAEKDTTGCLVGMATCHHCEVIWDARRLLARMNGWG